MALNTVADYLSSARVLLQDTDSAGYRYSNAELVDALNIAFMEANRVRPDLFFRTTIPTYSAASTSTTVALDQRYRSAFLYYIAGQAQLRDDEATQDARAAVFLNKFLSQLTTSQA
jgi:hypothetical protein